MDKKAANTNGKIKWKIPPDRIKSDDCTVKIGRVIVDGEITEAGTEWPVHTGEWVEVLPTRSLAEVMALDTMARMAGTEVDTAEASNTMKALCLELSERVVAWNWTGMDGVALPQPYRAPEVLEHLTDDEVIWLLSAVRGNETSAARKNA